MGNPFSCTCTCGSINGKVIEYGDNCRSRRNTDPSSNALRNKRIPKNLNNDPFPGLLNAETAQLFLKLDIGSNISSKTNPSFIEDNIYIPQSPSIASTYTSIPKLLNYNSDLETHIKHNYETDSDSHINDSESDESELSELERIEIEKFKSNNVVNNKMNKINILRDEMELELKDLTRRLSVFEIDLLNESNLLNHKLHKGINNESNKLIFKEKEAMTNQMIHLVKQQRNRRHSNPY
eukprot:276553_1